MDSLQATKSNDRPRRQMLRGLVLAGLLCCASGALAEHYTVPLLVPAGASSEPQGVLRILNAEAESGAVEIYAIDDAGTRTGPVTFTLNASAAVEFTATDLQSGNATLGLTGGIGTDVGDARLQIETDLDIVPLAFVRAVDGTLSAMHDTVRGASTDGSAQFRYEVPVFNPSTETTRVSRLRLINPGDAAAAVTVSGRDDGGAQASGGDVTLTLAAGGATTLTAQQLEAGDTDLTGRLGAGTGKWRLTVSSDQPLEVVNIVASTAGYWNNLSTTAVGGAAPADLDAFNGRFAGSDFRFATKSDGSGFTFGLSETGHLSPTVSHEYESIGPDAGYLAVVYEDGYRCRFNMHFVSGTEGWFSYECDDGSLVGGGNWSARGSDDMPPDTGTGEPGDGADTTYGVDDTLPGVPTSGFFIPAMTIRGSVTATASGTTVALDNGGYIELNDGTRYTCASAGGCSIVNGTVTAGTVTGRAADAGEVDRFPSFRTASNPGNQSYTVGTAIDTLTLPVASGGNGDLTYSLSPSVPGLTFNATTRQLTGSPSTAGTYAMSYTVRDEDGDTDTLGFTITVSAGTATEGSLGVCQVGMTISSGQSCTYPGTTDEFSVNARGRGSFLDRLAGIRIRFNNETINGRDYDFEASHQGDGVWRIDRIAGSTEVPTGTGNGTDTGTEMDLSPSFAAGAGPGSQTYTVGTAIETLTLPEASGGNGTLTYSLSPDVPGLTFNAASRELTGTPTAAAIYNMTYMATDEDGDAESLDFVILVEDPDDIDGAAGNFDLVGNSNPTGITFGNDRFFVLDNDEDKVTAYSRSGERDASADFDLDPDNVDANGLTYANGRIFVLDSRDERVYAYMESGHRDAASDFDLHFVNSSGITHANGRFFILDWADDRVYAFTESGHRDAASDFDLHAANARPSGITHGERSFYVPDRTDRKVYAYTDTGERDAAGDFDLHAEFDPSYLVRIAYANDRFYVIDREHGKVRSFSITGEELGDDDDAPGGEDSATEPPPPPMNIELARQGSNIRVSWDASPGASHYEVWRCDTRNVLCGDGVLFVRSNWTNLARNVTATSYIDRNPPTSTSFVPFRIFYVVQACNSAGCSGIL